MGVQRLRLKCQLCFMSWSSDESYSVAISCASAGFPLLSRIDMVHCSLCPGDSLSRNVVHFICSLLSGTGFWIVCEKLCMTPFFTHAYVSSSPLPYESLYLNVRLMRALLIFSRPLSSTLLPEMTLYTTCTFSREDPACNVTKELLSANRSAER